MNMEISIHWPALDIRSILLSVQTEAVSMYGGETEAGLIKPGFSLSLSLSHRQVMWLSL